jgi:hypothetical protein
MALYKALLIYPDPEFANRERGTDIIFESDGHAQAAHDAVRWFKNRQNAAPDFYGALWCLKLALFTPDRIDSTGALPPALCPVFEWKYDWGGTVQAHIESKLGEV